MIIKQIECQRDRFVITLYTYKAIYGQGYEFIKPKHWGDYWKVIYNFKRAHENDQNYKIPDPMEVKNEFIRILKEEREINRTLEVILENIKIEDL